MSKTGKKPGYKRILLKLSGEALMGGADYGIDCILYHIRHVFRWYFIRGPHYGHC